MILHKYKCLEYHSLTHCFRTTIEFQNACETSRLTIIALIAHASVSFRGNESLFPKINILIEGFPLPFKEIKNHHIRHQFYQFIHLII
jgi:hypothetical protein